MQGGIHEKRKLGKEGQIHPSFSNKKKSNIETV